MDIKSTTVEHGNEIALVAMSAGEAMRRHQHPYAHTLDVLTGKVEVEIGGAYSLAGPGAHAFFPARVAHSFRALEDSTLAISHSVAATDAAEKSGEGVTQAAPPASPRASLKGVLLLAMVSPLHWIIARRAALSRTKKE